MQRMRFVQHALVPATTAVPGGRAGGWRQSEARGWMEAWSREGLGDVQPQPSGDRFTGRDSEGLWLERRLLLGSCEALRAGTKAVGIGWGCRQLPFWMQRGGLGGHPWPFRRFSAKICEGMYTATGPATSPPVCCTKIRSSPESMSSPTGVRSCAVRGICWLLAT